MNGISAHVIIVCHSVDNRCYYLQKNKNIPQNVIEIMQNDWLK